MEEDKKARFQNFIDMHNEFAKAYKTIEPLVDKMDATTHNDIRYALRAIVDCIECTITEKDDKRFEEAASATDLALRIVWNDVVDITFDSFRIYLDELGKIYGPDIVEKYIDTSTCRELLFKVDELVAESRGDRDRRVELYKQISSDNLLEVKKLFTHAQASEPAIAAAKKKEERNDSFKRAALLVSIVIMAMIFYINFIQTTDKNATANVPIEQPAEKTIPKN